MARAPQSLNKRGRTKTDPPSRAEFGKLVSFIAKWYTPGEIDIGQSIAGRSRKEIADDMAQAIQSRSDEL